MTMDKLAHAVDHMADTLKGLDFGNTFGSMTCEEVESIAAVLAVAGHVDAAAHVLMMHGDGDSDEGDVHEDVYLALQEPGAGFSWSEDDEPFRLAMVHARQLV
jgi:hypothetical protein